MSSGKPWSVSLRRVSLTASDWLVFSGFPPPAPQAAVEVPRANPEGEHRGQVDLQAVQEPQELGLPRRAGQLQGGDGSGGT